MFTVPHSGEVVPEEADWLRNVPESVLLTDVDRFVDLLYRPASLELGIPMEVMPIHRYVLDLNRLSSDIDPSSVAGAKAVPAAGTPRFASGFHWVKTTQGHPLLTEPMSLEKHKQLVSNYYVPYHERVKNMESTLLNGTSIKVRYHLDLHSMPSIGTGSHRDSGRPRSDLVISDCEGKTCSPEFKDQVIDAFTAAGFSVSYNWPYLGGRMCELYGKPQEGKHSVQVELNRGLYMNEGTHSKNAQFDSISERLRKALTRLCSNARTRR